LSKIFISHSSHDNFEAQALADWLAEVGWNEVFLDLDPQRGITAGERWERKLHEASQRCEAVIFLVSKNWLASGWCVKEFALARGLNKKLFAVIVEQGLAPADLPPEYTGTWQAIDLCAGQDLRLFRTKLPDSHEEKHIAFSQSGLRRLKSGIEKGGLDPKFFVWPPVSERDRAPYRGLKPLESVDAGIFFGREAPITETIDRMRGLIAAAPPRLLVILGASGAGKSSFLRAGLLPRLARDDKNFLPLPVIRPERSPLTGDNGLLGALEKALPSHTRPAIRAAIHAGAAALRPLLSELVESSLKGLLAEDRAAKPPAIVVSIDQAEELLRPEGAGEGDALLALLRDLTTEDSPAVIVIFAIRSDSYDALEHAKALEGLGQGTLPLLPMPRAAYKDVIEGPARRYADAGNALTIEPQLSERLLSDIDKGGGSDALPLLAFTLEQLFLDYRRTGALRLTNYEDFGGLRGAIDAAVERAFQRADADSRIPRERKAREALLRRGLIPWLAGIDPESKSPRRHIARRVDIPVEAGPLIDLLVEERLLSTDTVATKDSTTGGQGRVVTIEPAHEALLRQWGLLQGWLEEDFGLLATLEGIKRAARDWEANAQADGWLSHHGQRLVDAGALDVRRDIAARLDATDRQYLSECRAKEERQTARSRRARLQRALALASIAFLALTLAIGAPWAYAELSKEWNIATEAARTDLRGQIIAYAVVDGGLEQDTAPGRQTSPYTTPLLERLGQRDKSVLDAIQEVHQDVIDLSKGSQRPFLSTSMNGGIFLWKQPATRAKKAIVVSVSNPGFCCVINGPIHDGDGVYSLLRETGFPSEDIIRSHNSDRQAIEDAVDTVCKSFSQKEAGLAPAQFLRSGNNLLILFFSGHGVTIRERKYLIPSIGVQPPASDDDLAAKSVDLASLEAKIESCAAASIMIIDTHFPKPSLNYNR
jgi:hypothetical protein